MQHCFEKRAVNHHENAFYLQKRVRGERVPGAHCVPPVQICAPGRKKHHGPEGGFSARVLGERGLTVHIQTFDRCLPLPNQYFLQRFRTVAWFLILLQVIFITFHFWCQETFVTIKKRGIKDWSVLHSNKENIVPADLFFLRTDEKKTIFKIMANFAPDQQQSIVFGWLFSGLAASLYNVDFGHRAIIFDRVSGVKDEGTHFRIQFVQIPCILDVGTHPRLIPNQKKVCLFFFPMGFVSLNFFSQTSTFRMPFPACQSLSRFLASRN